MLESVSAAWGLSRLLLTVANECVRLVVRRTVFAPIESHQQLALVSHWSAAGFEGAPNSVLAPPRSALCTRSGLLAASSARPQPDFRLLLLHTLARRVELPTRPHFLAPLLLSLSLDPHLQRLLLVEELLLLFSATRHTLSSNCVCLSPQHCLHPKLLSSIRCQTSTHRGHQQSHKAACFSLAFGGPSFDRRAQFDSSAKC